MAVHPEAFPVRGDHFKLLERRLEHFRQHPDDRISREALKARLQRLPMILPVEFLAGADAELQEIFSRSEDDCHGSEAKVLKVVDAYL